jgi:phosphoribosylamine---glycine ligase
LRGLDAGPYVVKTDGLAAGKGVLVTPDLDDAIADVRAKLAGSTFGNAGRRVVIEEGLTGEELSVMAVCDGQRAVPLAGAQDFKRIGDGDTGPNTGGMGAYSPVGQAGSALVAEVIEGAVEPTLAALRSRGIDYRGVLYAGIMLTERGPKVLEFNVRFGDPESQVLFPRWQGDVAEVLAAAAAGRLDLPVPRFVQASAVCVVMASAGYPGSPETGDVIEGLDRAAMLEGVDVYAAGVGADDKGRLVTAGGRVLGVTAVASGLAEARERAYAAVGAIRWRGASFRHDIAERAVLVSEPAGGRR